jgi:hypothetical protein
LALFFIKSLREKVIGNLCNEVSTRQTRQLLLMLYMGTPEQNKLWRAYFAEGKRQFEAWQASGFDEQLRPTYPPLPAELRAMTCGAKTRGGTPCKRRDLCDCGRCRLHGGMSTGPKTERGKQRSALNGFARKKKQTP